VSIKENSIEVNNLKWFYRHTEIDSDKLPVLLLHGLPSHSYCWRGMMNKLADSGYRSIAPDWIGSGMSAKPEKREFAYTPEAFLKALEALIETLEIKKFYLVVQGFLGSIGLLYALRHSDRIERLVILNTPLSPAVKLPWKMQQWGIPFVGDMLTQDPLLVDRTLEGGSGFVINDKDLNIYRKPYLTTSAVGRALVATIKNLNLAKTMAELESGLVQWQVPTQIIWGMQDPWLGSEKAENLAANNPQIELVSLSEAKHYPQEHWANEISEATIHFFRRQVL
jgi:pimeloyl-ACP methyl ester carboxylesterase